MNDPSETAAYAARAMNAVRTLQGTCEEAWKIRQEKADAADEWIGSEEKRVTRHHGHHLLLAAAQSAHVILLATEQHALHGTAIHTTTKLNTTGIIFCWQLPELQQLQRPQELQQLQELQQPQPHKVHIISSPTEQRAMHGTAISSTTSSLRHLS